MALTDTNNPPVLPNSDEESQEQLAENSAKANNDQQLQEYREKQKAKQLEEQFKSQIAILKRIYDEYLELFKVFYRFNLQWLNKVEDFPAYEARFVNNKITDLKNVRAKLKDKIDELEKVVTAINKNHDEKCNELLKTFSDCRDKLNELVEKISGYEAVQGDNNYEHRFNSYKPVAEAVQHLQYTLQFLLNIALDGFINPGKLKPLQIHTKPPSITLPGDLLRQISNRYLSVKDTLILTNVAKSFFGIPSSLINLEAKRRRLKELKDFGFAVGYHAFFVWCNKNLYVWDEMDYRFDPYFRTPAKSPVLDLTGLNLSATDKIKQIYMTEPVKPIFLLTEEARFFKGESLYHGFTHEIIITGTKIRQVAMFLTSKVLETTDGRWFVWGANHSGELGLGDNETRNVPTVFDLRRLNLSPSDKIKQFDSGVSSILLTEAGRCFVWGYNHFGALGLGDNVDRNIPTELDLRSLNLLVTDKIKQIISGDGRRVLLTEQGRYFVSGWNRYGQLGVGDNADRNIFTELDLSRLNLSSADRIKHLALGHTHSILLTEAGRCFVCGENSHGQLGLGDNNHRNIPIELDLSTLKLSAIDKIKQVVASYEYTILLTEEGRCFVCGRNNNGQLGLGDTNDRNIPTELDLKGLNLSPSDRVKQVILSEYHTILLTEEWNFLVVNRDRYASNRLTNGVHKEDFYPALKEKRELTKSISDDISQLAFFAFDNTDYGIDFKRMLLAKNNVLSCPWLHQLVINVFKNRRFNESFYSLMNALIKFGDFYHYFAANKPSTDQGIRLIDFVTLLKIISSGEIDNKEKLANHLNETANTLRIG